jgi:TonB-dependent receptor
MAISAQSVQAQTTATDGPVQHRTTDGVPAPGVAEVVVTAPADPSASGKAITTKRDLGVISDGISDVQISSTPEFGLGDALAAVPGVSFIINNGRGEDQFMTVRGLNPDYNTVTIDGMALPSTEETVRSLSFDVFPAFLVNQANVYKSWTVDQPSDAIGSVTNLETRSALDHPGPYMVGHVDMGYWGSPQKLRPNTPSGQADLVMSNTFGPDNRFGLLGMISYYQRSSNTVNTTTSNYAYYPSSAVPANNVLGLDQTSKTAIGETLLPSQNVAGLIAVPQTHQYYYYDDLRTRTGAFLRLDYNDHSLWRAALSGGYFKHDLNENRYYQYLDSAGPVNILTATNGNYAQGKAGVDYDHYHDVRQVAYIDFHGSVDFSEKTHLDFNVNYGEGHYRQDGVDEPFSTATSSAFPVTYDLAAPSTPLLTSTGSAYMNPASYAQGDYQLETDQSVSKLPQVRIDFKHNADVADMGFGVSAGLSYRDLSQVYSYDQTQWNPIVAPTLAAVGTLNKTITPYDGEGQTLLLGDPVAAAAYLTANPANYTRNAGDIKSNELNNFTLNEAIGAGYLQGRYRSQQFEILAGLREEWTQQAINNFLPFPFNSTTKFVQTNTTQNYTKLLPSLNISYRPLDTVIVHGAITQDLARPEYSQLGQNSAASLTTTATGGTASQTISNPHLLPREATNYDLSFEYYPTKGALASVAVFYKDISNEILRLSSTQQGVTIPGYALPVALTTSQYENASKSSVKGIEFNVVYASFDALPGLLKGFGARANATFMDYDAPNLLMADGTFRHLPQLTSAAKVVANAAVFYKWKGLHWEVAYNHTGKQPISFDTNNAANDQWWAAIDSFDAQIGYQITQNLDFRVQLKNFTDATPQKVEGPTQNLNLSLLQNGRAFYAGVAFHY